MAKKQAKLRIDRIIVAGLALILIIVFCSLLISSLFKASDDTADSNQSTDIVDEVDDSNDPDSTDATDLDVDLTGDEDDTSALEAATASSSTVGATNLDVDWNLILVNPWNALVDEFTVETSSLTNGLLVDARILDELNAMLDDAIAAGQTVIVCSAYRTYEKQLELFEEDVQDLIDQGYTADDAALVTATSTAIPGTSEHQTGLAVDLVALDYQMLDDGQATQSEQAWLVENCYKYGFILRYPEGKEDITGIVYESWHYRYVGVEAATAMVENGWCLEEYYTQMGL